MGLFLPNLFLLGEGKILTLQILLIIIMSLILLVVFNNLHAFRNFYILKKNIQMYRVL